MPSPTVYILTLIFLHTYFTISKGASVSALNSLEKSDLDAGADFSTKIGDFLQEAEMESEISRRLLIVQKKYISYETLKRDMVPCDKPGASYYDCHTGEANPYGRGCETIIRCRGH